MNDIIILGGSSGIGLCLCQKLSGYNITNISRSACPVAGVKNYIADAGDSDELGKVFSRIDRADTIIYCAGVSLAAPAEYADPEDYEGLFRTNLIGAVSAVKYGLPLLKNSAGAKILLLSSSGGIAPIAYDSFYSASKAALIMFARAMRLETDIPVTAAVIGGTRTRFSFKRKIYTDCDAYDDKLKTAADALIKIEQTGYPATAVADKLINVLKSKNPPPVVTIGIKNKFLLGMYKILPQRLKTAADKKIYGLK